MDRQAWRDFFITVFLLGIAFVIAVLSSIAAQQGDIRLGAVAAGVSLLIAVIGAIYIIPRLARRVQLEFIRFAVRTSVTVEGLFFVLLLVVIGFAAWNTANNLLYLILSAMLAFLFAANMISRITLGDLSMQLRFPDHIFAGEPAYISIAVTNHKRLVPAFSLLVEPLSEKGRKFLRKPGNEVPKSDGSASEQTITSHKEKSTNYSGNNSKEPGQKGGNRKVADSRSLGKLAHFVLIPPRSTATHRVEYKFLERGVYPITSFKISTKFPTGFFKKWRKIDATGEIVVYPKPRSLDDFYHTLPMLTGQISSQFRGSGDDLYGIRRYHPSDHIRHIDWKATAKASTLMVRDHLREDERRLTIIFDTSRPEHSRKRPGSEDGTEQSSGANRPSDDDPDWFEGAFERAIVMAASLANHFLQEGAEVELLTSSEGRNVESGKGIEHLYKLLRLLATLQPDSDTETPQGPMAYKLSARQRERDPQSAASSSEVGKYALSNRRRGKERHRHSSRSEPVRPGTGGLRQMLGEIPVLSDERRFKVFITPAAKGSIPANIWRSSHVVFMRDLKEEPAALESTGEKA